MGKRVVIFDTTLRDGEQSPGCKMDVNSKLLVARQLAKLGVDVIEAGFPIASDGDFEAVSQIARKVAGPTICALSRTREEDIERAARALEGSIQLPRIHVFVATSDVHIKKKLRRSQGEILEMVSDSVRRAKTYVSDIEFSPEDAARTGREFLAEVVRVAIENGATTINIPDTVGYSVGREYYDLIKFLRARVREINSVVISTHCHNDLGLAVSNTLSAIEAGARQLECCVLGIGERAGNAQLEAVVMALKTRADHYDVEVGLKTKELGKTARLVASIIGKQIPDNLPVVGANAFAHSAGIHQHGVFQDRATYEIMKPEDVGWEGESTPLTKHSGRHALQKRLQDIGYQLNSELLGVVYRKFTNLADTKVYVYNDDLRLLWQEASVEVEAQKTHLIIVERVDYHRVGEELSAEVTLSQNGNRFNSRGSGDGPVSSVWKAVLTAISEQGIISQEPELKDFNIGKATGGAEAVGLVTIRIESDGYTGYGRGSDTDIVLASAKAMVAAINHLIQAPIKN